jgi:hypothetical protein
MRCILSETGCKVKWKSKISFGFLQIAPNGFERVLVGKGFDGFDAGLDGGAI